MEQPVTKPVTKAFRSAVLTIYQVDSYAELPCDLNYFAYAKETCPTTGRSHLQAFAYSCKVMRLPAWKKIFPTAHIEPMRGAFAESDVYCSKQSALVEFGVRPMGNGKRRDLADACYMILGHETLYDVSLKMPEVFVRYHNGLRALSTMHTPPYQHDTTRGYWLWGVSGAGKTHYAEERFPNAYQKPQNKWFDGYIGQDSIILNDYDCGKALGHYLKIWMDKWACTGEYKGGTIQLRHHHFVVTSNYSIEEQFAGDEPLIEAIRRRCEVIHFSQVFKKKKE